MAEKEFDIEKRSYKFSLDLIKFTRSLPKVLENSVLVRQALRSGTSIGANIHEARGGSTAKDFANYYSIALKSANETIYWLNLIKDTNKKFSNEADVLIDEAEQLAKIVAKISIKSRNNKKDK